MSDTVTHATDSNVAKQKKPGDDTPTAHTPPPPSRERKSSDKGRRFRDGNGSVIYENIAEEKLQELRDSIYAMPGGRKRDSYEQALKICEAEWERIKQQGPID